jgi:Leucine-rich repeat (LRR) protein
MTSVKDFRPLNTLKKLRELDVSYTEIKSGFDIAECTSLKKFIAYKSSFQFTYGFENLVNLETFWASYSPLENLWGLKDLPKLKTIYVHNTSIEDLFPIATLKELRSIDCSNTMVKSLESAYGHPKLEYLRCENTLVTEKDISHAQRFVKTVSNMPVKQFEPNEEVDEMLDRSHKEYIEGIRKNLDSNNSVI